MNRDLRELLDRAKKATAQAQVARKRLCALIEQIEAEYGKNVVTGKPKRSKGRR